MRSCERILADHKKWLAAEDKTGLDHLRADLSRADLRGQEAILKEPNCRRPTSARPNCEGA